MSARTKVFLADFLQRPQVGDAHPVLRRQLAAQVRADVARGAGDQDGLHVQELLHDRLNSAARSKKTEWPELGTQHPVPLAPAPQAGPGGRREQAVFVAGEEEHWYCQVGAQASTGWTPAR